MRSSIVLVAATAALVAAQATPDLSKIPSCATTCATTGIAQSGCKLTDFECICKSTGFLTGVAGCVRGTCDTGDQQKTIVFASSLCDTYGVTLPTSLLSASAEPTKTGTSTGTSSVPVPTTTGTSTSGNSTKTNATTTKGSSTPSVDGSSSGSLIGISTLALTGAFAAFFLL